MIKSFNFGRKLVANSVNQSLNRTKFNVEKSSIDAGKKKNTIRRDLSKTSALLATTIDLKEESEETKTTKLLEKIMTSYQGDKVPETKECCIDNSKRDFNFLTEIENTLSELTNFKFTSPLEEKESSMLIEKGIVDKYEEENTHYLMQIKKLKEKIESTKDKLFHTKGENNFVKQASDYQNALESDNAKQLELTENMIKESKETNKRLKNQLVVAQLQKQSLFRAVNYYIEKENPQLSEEYKRIYNKYNNQTYLMRTKPLDQKKVDDLFKRITFLQKMLNAKNKEIKNLERFVIPEKKQDKNKKKKKPNNINDNKGVQNNKKQ